MDRLQQPSVFTTEVHHVTGEGNDGGVVYSEMEGVYYDVNYQALLRAVNKDTGYGAFEGGALKNLRENTTLQMVNKTFLEYK